jgi:outer membrane protein assembly factor BamE (lipoprotein component of BamABCDE complex)
MSRVHLYSAIAAMAAVTLIAACASDLEQRGNLPEHDKLLQIHPGTTTKAEVEQLLGSPSSTGVFDGNAWYYISKETKRVAFFNPDVLNQQVYIVRFNDKDVVDGIDHKTLKDGHTVAMAPGETPAPGRQLTFFEQLIGNIGRFNSGGS